MNIDVNDDFRSPHVREKVTKALEDALKSKPPISTKAQMNDPRKLEEMIFERSGNKDDYYRTLNSILQKLGMPMMGTQPQHPPPQPMSYEMGMGGNVGGPQRGQMMAGQPQMMMGDTMMQQTMPNATISTGPLPQQHHRPMMTSQMDQQGRILQPPPNPYTTQQQLTANLSSQQMTMSPGGGMSMGAYQNQQHPPQAMQQNMGNRMMQPMTTGPRMGQPTQGLIISEGQRYAMPPQQRPGEFVRVGQQPRQQRPGMQQQPMHPMQTQAPHWANTGGPMMGTPAGGGGQQMQVNTAPSANEAVIVTHFGPGTVRNQQPITVRSDPNVNIVYQHPTMQQIPAARGGSMMPTQHSSASLQQPQHVATPPMPPRFEHTPRMPVNVQSQFVRTLTQPAPGVPSAAIPPSGGQYIPMPSPNAGQFVGPSPVAAAPTGSSQEPSPGYPTPSLGSVPRYTAPTEPSPASQTQPDTTVAEDPGYKEKIQELHMYLDPLKNLLEQHQKEGDKNTPQQQKLSRIIDIIQGKSKVSLDLLLKCEDTLKKMIHKPVELPKTRESAICQPLFDVVASLAKTSNASETLKRVFDLPPLDLSSAKRLCAPKYPDDPMPKTIEENFALKMAQLDSSAFENESKSPKIQSIPTSVQREVASLESRFKIMLDKAAASNVINDLSKADSSRIINVICDLEDQRLPHVPSLRLQIPNDYPVSSPKYDCNLLDYCGTPFLDSLREMLISRLTKLGTNCSITSLLDNWESTVRQACLSQ